MADPLSVAAAVLGIAVPALEVTKLLLDDLQKLKDAPKTVTRLKQDVQSVVTALTLLRGIGDREWESLGMSVAEESKTMISTCKQVCDLFRTDLQRWTRHSEAGTIAWRDRAKVGIFKQGQIKSMSDQLQNCKITITTVVSIATFYSSVRHSHVTEEIKKIINMKQTEVKSAITTTDKQLVILESKLDDLDLNSDDEEASTLEEGKDGALRQLAEERKALNASRKLLNELMSKSQEEAIAKAAAGYKGVSYTATFDNSQNWGVQAGVVHGGVAFGGK